MKAVLQNVYFALNVMNNRIVITGGVVAVLALVVDILWVRKVVVGGRM
jgi:uncharacterized membrane protein